MLLRESIPALNLRLCYFSGFQGFREFRVFEGFKRFWGYRLVEGFKILVFLSVPRVSSVSTV